MGRIAALASNVDSGDSPIAQVKPKLTFDLHLLNTSLGNWTFHPHHYWCRCCPRCCFLHPCFCSWLPLARGCHLPHWYVLTSRDLQMSHMTFDLNWPLVQVSLSQMSQKVSLLLLQSVWHWLPNEWQRKTAWSRTWKPSKPWDQPQPFALIRPVPLPRTVWLSLICGLTTRSSLLTPLRTNLVSASKKVSLL